MKFYDTCSLLDLQQDAFKENFFISSITLVELEEIKTSGLKDEEIKWSARQLLYLLDANEEMVTVIPYNTIVHDAIIKTYGLMPNNDSRIIVTAFQCYKGNSDLIFVTSDAACREVAKSIGLPVKSTFADPEEDYLGYEEIIMDNTKLALFYSEILPQNLNFCRLLENEYLLIKDTEDNIIDKYKWKEDRYIQIPFCKAESRMFGKVTPKNQDPYQQIALDSLANNQVTLLRGPAGSGKSYLAFARMFELLESGKIDKVIIFCNTVATKGSAKLGFYPGSRTEKLLDSQIGNLLESKLGDKMAVEKLIDEGQLVLLPLSDIRGYDTTGMNAAIYISEAQNLDIELMRLALQRIGEDSICIIDGDYTHQVDMAMYAGARNGMRRVGKVFKGQPFFGEVTLKNIHRSKIAEIAEQL